MRLIDYPVLYINLEKDKKRRIVLEKDLNKLNVSYQRIEAVYGKNLYDNKYRNRIAKILGLNEIFKPTVVASLLVKFPVGEPVGVTALSPNDVCA